MFLTEGETIGFDPRHAMELDSRALSLLHGKNRDFKVVVEQRHLDATMQCRESHGDGCPLQIEVMFMPVHA